MQTRQAKIWQLRKGMDRRVRGGHPWVYSNELRDSPQGIVPGQAIELRDAAGKFVAHGYGNPHSLIAFRVVSRDPQEGDAVSFEGVLRKLKVAVRWRQELGWDRFSHRLCFGEADGLPGLVIDRYVHPEGESAAPGIIPAVNSRVNEATAFPAKQPSQGSRAQTFVVQAHTAGAHVWLSQIESLLYQLEQETWGAQVAPAVWAKTSLVFRNDLAVRKLEGLQVEFPQIVKQAEGFDLRAICIQVRSADVLSDVSLPFWVDLVEGQKTGFFLDQSANIEQALLNWFGRRPPAAGVFELGLNFKGRRPVRILDLCCYVGQWSAQLTAALKRRGVDQIEVLAVDSSAKALALAQKNITTQGAECKTLKGDVLHCLAQLPGPSEQEGSVDPGFDFVIADPPALIKSRKDVPAGTRAYQKLMAQAYRLASANGRVVCCSCSGLLDPEAFAQVLTQASRVSGRVPRWMGQGGHASDHPLLPEFPEGRYLKAWVGGFVPSIGLDLVKEKKVRS